MGSSGREQARTRAAVAAAGRASWGALALAAAVAAVVGAAAARLLGPAPAAATASGRSAQLDALAARLEAAGEQLSKHERALAALQHSLAETTELVFEARREQAGLREQLEEFALAGLATGPGVHAAGSRSGPAALLAEADSFGPRAGGLAARSAAPQPAGAEGSAAPVPASGQQAPPPEMVAAARLALEQAREEERRQREQAEAALRLERAQRMVERLSERLQLLPQQQEQLTSLLYQRDEQRRAAFRAVREGQLDPEQARAQAQQAEQAYEQALQQVLTPQQYAELEAIRAEQREEGRRRWRGPGEEGTGEGGRR
ncbi:MAG: hypothetical protein KatS3mg102_0851 [Planctomycetota bacterium]|nr:MAG: hypothetical protein KatS3mg102_0851 [Planctomycetota bacterium]